MKPLICFALLFANIYFSGCSLQKKTGANASKKAEPHKKLPEETPSWVYAPEEGCGEEEICAVGEGESLSAADISSKKGIAAIFSTKIQSQLDIHKTSFESAEISELKEFVLNQVGETVDGVLKSVEVKLRYEKNGLYFSLASLNKKKAADSIHMQIDSIDSELVHLYGLKRKSSIKRMMGLLDERAMLSDKLLVIDGSPSQPPVSFGQVQNIKYANKEHRKVFIRAAINVPNTLAKFFEQTMVNSGYQVLDEMAVAYVIDLRYEAKQAYLNVEGFKKFVFSFRVAATNNLGEKIGGFNVVQTQTGRTEQDAYLRVKPKIQEEIEDEFDKLNLK